MAIGTAGRDATGSGREPGAGRPGHGKMKSGSDPATIRRNTAIMIAEGMPENQAVAAAHEEAKRSTDAGTPDPSRSWIGVDLDGTLAYYDGYQGEEAIGAPILPMVIRVKAWLACGLDVRIFTARASTAGPDAIKAIEAWCLEHIGQILPITATKDQGMIALYDDRAVRVQRNTGLLCHGQE